jgi:hypothetical protein
MSGREAVKPRHCERKRSNPESHKQELDCFVASAPRNDEKPATSKGGGPVLLITW